MRIKCDKCGSERVTEFACKDIFREKLVTMSEYIKITKQMPIMNAVYKTYKYKLRCNDCGFEKEYWK